VAAYRAESLPAPTVKLLNDASLVGVAMTGFPTVVSMAGYLGAMFHRGLLSAPVRWFGVVVTFAHLVSGGAYAASGMLSPAGIGVYVAPVMYYLWLLVVSIELLVRPPPAT
jgi:hypothetical protein